MAFSSRSRQIPSIPWYRQAPVQMIMAGFLPFSAIYIGCPLPLSFLLFFWSLL